MNEKPSRFGERLRWLREKNALTLEEFSKRIGFGKSYLSKLERGINRAPSDLFIVEVCKAYLVNREWLLEGVGAPFCGGPSSQDGPESSVSSHDPSMEHVEELQVFTVIGMALQMATSIPDLATQVALVLNVGNTEEGQLGAVYRRAALILAKELEEQLFQHDLPARLSKRLEPVTTEARAAKEMNDEYMLKARLVKKKIPVQ